jgi:hypothetical protein
VAIVNNRWPTERTVMQGAEMKHYANAQQLAGVNYENRRRLK